MPKLPKSESEDVLEDDAYDRIGNDGAAQRDDAEPPATHSPAFYPTYDQHVGYDPYDPNTYAMGNPQDPLVSHLTFTSVSY